MYVNLTLLFLDGSHSLKQIKQANLPKITLINPQIENGFVFLNPSNDYNTESNPLNTYSLLNTAHSADSRLNSECPSI